MVDREQLQALIQEAAKAEIQDAVYEYVTRLTQASREHPMVQLGVSPRGALAVCRMAKAYAYLTAGTLSSRGCGACSRMCAATVWC